MLKSELDKLVEDLQQLAANHRPYDVDHVGVSVLAAGAVSVLMEQEEELDQLRSHVDDLEAAFHRRGSDVASSRLVTEQRKPQPNDLPHVWDLVVADMRERDRIGTERYDTPLQPFNGRNALVDAYQEALDLVVYLRQKIYEETGK